MVLLLRSNIPTHFFYLRLTDRERTVTSLPIECIHSVLLHPSGTIAFDIADHFADVDPPDRNKKMYMIGDASGDDHPALVVLDDAGNVGVKASFKFHGNQWPTVLGRENDVYEDLD